MKTALIFGVTGQDGAYLSRLLLEKDYRVHGVKRRSSSLNTARLDDIYEHPMFSLHYGDVTDYASVQSLIARISADEIYNLAAQSHVAVSFEMPAYTAQVDALGALNILEAVRWFCDPDTKVYQASSSEMFGTAPAPQNEKTPFNPCSPYGVSKVFAYHAARQYREAYGMFVSNGILFNHESEMRGETFVTRKITRGLARILYGVDETPIRLGNIRAVRDWGHAEDYVRAMWAMLQTDEPDDYVIATGESHTVFEFLNTAAQYVDMELKWDGMTAYHKDKKIVIIDSNYARPYEVPELRGDAEKARRVLGWHPTVSFDQLVSRMMDNDLYLAAEEA